MDPLLKKLLTRVSAKDMALHLWNYPKVVASIEFDDDYNFILDRSNQHDIRFTFQIDLDLLKKSFLKEIKERVRKLKITKLINGNGKLKLNEMSDFFQRHVLKNMIQRREDDLIIIREPVPGNPKRITFMPKKSCLEEVEIWADLQENLKAVV